MKKSKVRRAKRDDGSIRFDEGERVLRLARAILLPPRRGSTIRERVHQPFWKALTGIRCRHPKSKRGARGRWCSWCGALRHAGRWLRPGIATSPPPIFAQPGLFTRRSALTENLNRPDQIRKVVEFDFDRLFERERPKRRPRRSK